MITDYIVNLAFAALLAAIAFAAWMEIIERYFP